MNKKNGSAGVSELLHIHCCVHNLKEFRVQKDKDQCGGNHLNIARPISVPVKCMHYSMYTFSEKVQRSAESCSATNLDEASLGSESCVERERERERERRGRG